MEKALFISELENLKYWNKKYTRVYFGSEFCQRLLPSMIEIKKVLRFVKSNDLKLSLVTPYVTDEGIIRIKKTFDFLKREKIKIEIIVNDWGVLECVRKNSNLTPVLGRLLTKQKKGPEIIRFMDRLPSETRLYFKSIQLSNGLLDFLRKKKIQRIEIDNLLQGVETNIKNMNISMYYPYTYVATTRYCIFSEHENEYSIGVFPCKKQCKEYKAVLEHYPIMPVSIILKGNAQFFKIKKLPNLVGLGVDRLIFQIL